MGNTLPKNWVECKLGEILKVKSGDGLTAADRNEGDVPVFGGNGITGYHNNFNREERTLVIGRVGYYCGSVHVAPPKSWITDNAFIVQFEESIIDFDFLKYLLVKTDLRINDSSTAQPVISGAKIYPLAINLPPLPEQNRIVAKLDTLFAQLELMKASLANIPVLLKNFRQQVLTQAVTGKLTEEWRKGKELEEWEEVELGEICNLKAGKFVSASEISNEKLDGYFPCYGANGLRGYVKTFTHTGRYSLIGRQGALCGNVHLIEGQFHATEHALVVTPLTNIDNIWMFFKLTSLELINYAKGVAQPGLSVMNLTPILIEVPPILEQREIVTRVESLFAKADAIEQQYQSLKTKIDDLPQALLHKAFKGELVPQLPTDGDAKDLLEEIKKLKGSLGKKK